MENLDPNEPYILSLDDDPDFNRLLKVVFKKEGIKLITTTSVESFIIQLKQQRPVLCLLDINLEMGQGAGFSLLQALRNKFGLTVPVIILSRRKDDQDISRALELGANDYISKPIDDDFLIHKINHYLKHDNIKPLPFYKVSDRDSNCTLTWSNKIRHINEFGITLQSPHFLSKGTMIKIIGKAVEDIFGTHRPVRLFVNRSWIDEQNHLYQAYCEYDYENQENLNHIRKYLLENSTN